METLTKPAFIVLVLLITGCDVFKPVEQIRLEDYKCSDKQLEAVTREYKLCKSSDYGSGYCFAQAKVTHCDKLDELTGE